MVPPGSDARVVFAPGVCPVAGLRLLCACRRVSEGNPAARPWAARRSGARLAAVLARGSHRQPLTVPDRTVDVRLCTERRVRREGEGETSVQQQGC